MLSKVISGGQTGPDIAGLRAAKAVGIQTGGWMPKRYMTEDGMRPEYTVQYGIREHVSDKYNARTAMNIAESDATVLFYYYDSPGSKLTRQICQKAGRPILDIDIRSSVDVAVAEIMHWLAENKVTILNVAGNRASMSPNIGIEQYVEAVLIKVFQNLANHI